MSELEELQTIEVYLANSVQRTVDKTLIDLEDLIETMKFRGMANSEIRTVLKNDLREGGRYFGAFSNGLGRTVGNTVEEAGGVASRALFEQAGVEQWQWQTAGVNVCPDCKPRNGDIRTLDQWRLVGLPKSGFSVCGHSCQCTLVPSGKGRKIRRRAERKKELKERFGN
tara:strand:- start:5572 stop:6078 length:507 start_codon:yes stop_codon:yes gene_type:complete